LLETDNELKRVAVEVDKAKELLIEREKDSKILDTLQDTEQEAYRYSKMKEEQKGLDEVAAFQEYHHKEKG
jgi:flagellar biosynthesis chaperone FliJ